MATLLRKKATVVTPVRKVLKKKLTAFRPLLFSRHPSHTILRTDLPLLPFRTVIRMGSTTPHMRERIECNTIQAVKNSASKLLMKQCFTRANVKTAEWWKYNLEGNIFISKNIGDRGTSRADLPYPIIAKSLHGSRGEGNTKLDTQEALTSWMVGKTLSNYIFEKFYTYSKEYRIHVTSQGCFYTCRKLLKNDAPEGTWQRHDDNSTWIVEENPKFMKPNNWNLIVADCVRALNSLGLDIGAFDVKTQGSSKTNPEWIILESCSAPSFGDITAQKYLQEIPKVLRRKYENNRI